MRLNRVFALVVLLVALALGVRAMLPVVSGDTGREDQIREAVDAWEDAFSARDVDRLMELYAEDAISMPPGFPTSVGKEAIEADFQWLFDTFTIQRQFTLVDIQMSGNLATRRGVWTQTLTPKDGGDPVIEIGKCVVIFTKSGDEWLVVWEIWNTDG
jgi:ketosteroid isomerase-like protein